MEFCNDKNMKNDCDNILQYLLQKMDVRWKSLLEQVSIAHENLINFN